MKKANIWLIGLAVMWANLARNIAKNWYKTIVYNRTESVTNQFVSDFWNENLIGSYDLKQFVDSIETPRKIIIMVKAWNPVDAVIENLLPLLEKDDIIIDCWNSYYKDTQKRYEQLKQKSIRFVWCGVSGWEEWALNWPSIMPGWDRESYEQIRDILHAISANDFSWKKCETYIWENWAWHYIKMLHNGIEYAIMQMITEWYDSLRKLYKLNPKEISEIFKKYNDWKLNSYLIEITYKVLAKKDSFDENKYLIDYILDKAWAKWTGKWTSIEWFDRAESVSTIWEATFARAISEKKQLREKLSNIYNTANTSSELIELQEYLKILENTLYIWMIFAYAQWYALIKETAQNENWHINLSEISRIWQWGCIIRAKLLEFLTDVFKSNTDFEHIFELTDIKNEIQNWLNDYKKHIKQNMLNEISSLSLSAWLNYFYAITQKQSSANLIQWLRDYFWAHIYERTDKQWTFHTEW